MPARFKQVDCKNNLKKFILENDKNMQITLSNLGARLVSLIIPNKDGILQDIVLGYDNLSEYLNDSSYMGAIVGRYANRIKNGSFKLDNKLIQLDKNEGEHHLHGGKLGFDKYIWDAKPGVSNSEDEVFVIFTMLSKDLDQNYPGNLQIEVIYTLTQENKLKIKMQAQTDKNTIINLTHHPYWNLNGHDSGDILEHSLMINSKKYLPVDKSNIPTGAIKDVLNTKFDFTEFKPISSNHLNCSYDNCYVLNNNLKDINLCASVKSEISGINLNIFTNQQGLQFYTGDHLAEVKGKSGVSYIKHSGLCLEPQNFPDSINHIEDDGWQSCILRPGDIYENIIEYKLFI